MNKRTPKTAVRNTRIVPIKRKAIEVVLYLPFMIVAFLALDKLFPHWPYLWKHTPQFGVINTLITMANGLLLTFCAMFISLVCLLPAIIIHVKFLAHPDADTGGPADSA